MHLDNLLEHLNPYGPYQVLSWLVLATFTAFPPAWHQFSITFTAFFPSEYGCSTTNYTDEVMGDTVRKVLKSPISGDPCSVSVSRFHTNGSSSLLLTPVSTVNESCPVDNFWYSKNDPVTSTIITQWDLVCSREYLTVIISAFEGVGEIIGCIVFGFVADRIGRKKALFSSAAFLFGSGLLCAFAAHPYVAILSRLLIGLFLTGMLNSGFLMDCELFTSRGRTVFTTGGEILWGCAVISLGGIGYLIRDQFWLMIAITIPIVLILPFWWFLGESLHWQLSHGHIDEAKATLRRIARFNKVELDENLVQEVINSELPELVDALKRRATQASNSEGDESADDEAVEMIMKGKSVINEGGNLLDLFRTPRIRAITIVLTLLWLTNTMCYYGLQLAAQHVKGVDFYLSFFILAVVEIPSTFLVIPAMIYIGRRWCIIIFQVLAGVACIIVPFLQKDYEVASFVVAVIGKFLGCCSFSVVYIYAAELFPTSLRAIGFGVVSVIGRIGMIVAPIVNSLGHGTMSTVVPYWLRMGIYGVSLVATGFSTLLLPETNRQPMADTIDQMENYAHFCKEYQQDKADNKFKREKVTVATKMLGNESQKI